jgi:hypothetical protein
MQLGNQKQSVLLIVLGLVFTQLIIANYSLYGGFNYYGIKIQTGSLISFNWSTENRFLTTRFIGYIFFALFAFDCYKNGIKHRMNQFILIASICAFAFELKSIFADLSNEYNGQILQIGWILFLMSLVMLRDKMYNR